MSSRTAGASGGAGCVTAVTKAVAGAAPDPFMAGATALSATLTGNSGLTAESVIFVAAFSRFSAAPGTADLALAFVAVASADDAAPGSGFGCESLAAWEDSAAASFFGDTAVVRVLDALLSSSSSTYPQTPLHFHALLFS